MTVVDPLAPVTPLTAAELVCRHACDGLDGVRDVVQLISDFADCAVTPFWSLPRACKQRDLQLMQRLAARESPTMDKHHRALLFNEALVHAVKASACSEEGASSTGMAMVEWLCKSYCPYALVTKATVEAAHHGALEFMEWLVAHHKCVIWDDECGRAAAAGGHLHMLQWLHSHGVLSSRWVHAALPEACENGDRESVQYLLSLGATYFGPGMTAATMSGHFDIVKLLADVFEPQEDVTINAMHAAASSNQLEILQWLSSTQPTVSAPLAINIAASDGHLEIVQWLHKTCTEDCRTHAMDDAASNGHLDVIQWLHANCSVGCTAQAMNYAARNGHLAVVQWLHEHRSEGCTTQAMDGAAINGYLDIVQWLHTHRSEGCTTQAMNGAAQIGRLDIVQWLHAHRSEGCTFRAMNGAAQNGQFDVVQWLAENRSEGCTPIALTMAAGGGYLDILQWLHARYDKGCTANALVLAAEAGHLDVVQWLCETFELVEWTPGAIDAANTLEVLEWLRANRVESCTSRALDDAASRNNFDKLAFVRTHYPDVACSSQAIDSVVGNNGIEAFLWLYAHFPEQMDLSRAHAFYGNKHYWMQIFDLVGSKIEGVASGDADETARNEPAPEP